LQNVLQLTLAGNTGINNFGHTTPELLFLLQPTNAQILITRVFL